VFYDLQSKSANTREQLNRWCAKAGINKKISFHTARHTFATMLLTLDVDLYTVSKLLGHKDIKTTQIYAKIIDKKKRDAVNKIPQLF
jgi:Site-specific recombinase XerD